jgi:hypothetical protein
MNVTEPCQICNTKKPCACKNAVLSFFGLLEKAQARVLRVKPASTTIIGTVNSAGLDKLNAYFLCTTPVAVIKEQAEKYGQTVKRVFLKDRRPYLYIANEQAGVHLKLGNEETEVVGLVSNPNKFKGWSNYKHYIQNLLPEECLRSAKVSRLDLNMDFNKPFNELIQQIDLKNKRCALTFMDDGGSRTGIIVGKGKEQIVIYDKAKKERLDKPLSRIELRLSGNKLPTKSIFTVPETLGKLSFFNNISGFDVETAKGPLLPDQEKKLTQFESVLNRDGLFAAKRSLNKTRNFDRDFKSLINFKPWEIQPTDIFKNEINQFLQPKGGSKWIH